MLVFNRSIGEEVMISVGEETIIVKLVSTAGSHHARIGFTASKAVRIDRKEIHDAIAENGFSPKAKPSGVIRIGDPLPGAKHR